MSELRRRPDAADAADAANAADAADAPSSGETLFDRIGGDALRAVIEDFYARVFADVMIGFLFIGVDRRRLIDKEWELAARILGADVRYTGKPMRAAHRRHPIMGGHFDRRLQLLRDAMAAHGVDPEVERVWVEHTLRLRDQVTSDPDGTCNDPTAGLRTTGQ